MNVKDKAVVARWRARLRIRKALEAAARARHKAHPTDASRRFLQKRKDQVEFAERVIARRTGPKIKNLNLGVENEFGALGRITAVTGHHTAGPTDRNDDHAEDLFRTFHREHANKGWGGIGYHYGIGRSGTLFLLRPTGLKGAHVGKHNTGNIGVVCHGTTGDKPTAAQAATFAWLLKNAHTTALPESHRTTSSLAKTPTYGHNDWPGHETNSCPGTHKPMYLSRGKTR